MSPLDRLDWLRRVRDAGAKLSALAVAIEVAFRDGGDGAWGALEGKSIGDRAGRDGRAWLVANGLLRRIQRGWAAVLPSGTMVPESGAVAPPRHDGAGIRNDGAGAGDGQDAGTVAPESGTVAPPPAEPGGTVAPVSGTMVPEKRNHGATEQGLNQDMNQDAAAVAGVGGQPDLDPATAATAALSRVVDAFDPEVLRRALTAGSIMGVVGAFGANTDRPEREWVVSADGMPLGSLAAVLLWRSRGKATIREPSGLREAREAFKLLTQAERAGWAGKITAVMLRRAS